MPEPPTHPQPQTPRPGAGPRRQAQAMGRRVGGGLSWLMVATAVVKVASLANIAILGALLGKDDFGIFGTAIGVAALVNVLRDGGVRRILIQKGMHRFDGLVGPVYAWTLMLNVLAAIILCALGPVLARVHDNDEYVMVMVTLGIAAGIYGPCMIYRAKLAMQYRYKAVAVMNASSSIVRYVAMIALALGDAGPLTFTWSLVISAAYEWLYGLYTTRDPLVRLKPRTRLWPAIWARTKWLLLGAVALALLRQGDYLVLGFLLTESVMGVYVFAYMIGDQVMSLLASNLQQVLMPTMSAFQHDVKRHVASVLRVSGALTLVASGIAGGIAVTIDPLQQIIWQDKWDGAVPAVQALALCFSLRLLVTVQESALSSTGRFRTQFFALFAQGIGMAGVALVGGLLFPTEPGLIAAGVGLYFVLGVTGVAAWSLRSVGVPAMSFIATVLRPWGLLTLLAIVIIVVDHLVFNDAARTASGDGEEAGRGLVESLQRLVLSGTAYALAAAVLTRVLLPDTLRSILAIAPARVSKPAGALLRLKPTTAGSRD
ncbi:MAG: oligosaccharide flippase family protein [Phycisphaerales bacterium]